MYPPRIQNCGSSLSTAGINFRYTASNAIHTMLACTVLAIASSIFDILSSKEDQQINGCAQLLSLKACIIDSWQFASWSKTFSSWDSTCSKWDTFQTDDRRPVGISCFVCIIIGRRNCWQCEENSFQSHYLDSWSPCYGSGDGVQQEHDEGEGKGRELELFSAVGVVGKIRFFILFSTVFDSKFQNSGGKFLFSERTFPVAPVGPLNSESGSV